MRHRRVQAAFTLIELLVVVSIIAALLAILLPSLSKARKQARAAACSSNLRQLGQGMHIYADEHQGRLPPGRLPKIDDQNWQTAIVGGLKYRPTFLAMMGTQVGLQPFDDPQPVKNTVDRNGEPGDRQNYNGSVYLCPEVPHYSDERNGAYGYNYQFLGNSRLLDSSEITSFKNWPVKVTRVRSPSGCVAIGDCLGTAASFPGNLRRPYSNNSRDKDRVGNEGFNLDPPTVDPANGEMAGFTSSPQVRSAVDERHNDRANVLWVDSHAGPESLRSLGYSVADDGTVELTGNNRLWHLEQKNEAWVRPKSLGR